MTPLLPLCMFIICPTMEDFKTKSPNCSISEYRPTTGVEFGNNLIRNDHWIVGYDCKPQGKAKKQD